MTTMPKTAANKPTNDANNVNNNTSNNQPKAIFVYIKAHLVHITPI